MPFTSLSDILQRRSGKFGGGGGRGHKSLKRGGGVLLHHQENSLGRGWWGRRGRTLESVRRLLPLRVPRCCCSAEVSRGRTFTTIAPRQPFQRLALTGALADHYSQLPPARTPPSSPDSSHHLGVRAPAHGGWSAPRESPLAAG